MSAITAKESRLDMKQRNAVPASSAPRAVLVECPHCKQPGFVDMWPRIVSTVHEKAMELLLAGKLFEYTCPVCETSVAMVYECLLDDVKGGRLVLFSTGANAEERGSALLDDLLLKHAQAAPDAKRYQGRLVTTTYAFCEKARIFADGYDDRVIELLKVALGRGMLKEGIIGNEDGLIYERTMPDGGISFVVVGPNPGDVVGVPQGYDYLKHLVDDAEDELASQYCFDSHWANTFLP